MDERATGIVLRTRLLTETSLIVHWLTAEAGRIATVARGARRPKSPYRGKLDLFHEADLTFRRSARSELHGLGEVVLRETHPALRKDWRRLQQAAYGAAFIEQTVEMDTPVPEVWEEFRGFLGVLSGRTGVGVDTVLALELRLLGVLGLQPDLERNALSPEARRVARDLVGQPWGGVDAGVVEASVWRGLEQYLHGFLVYHLGRLPRGRSEALAVG